MKRKGRGDCAKVHRNGTYRFGKDGSAVEEAASEGLRHRKKRKARLAVERAALELVMEHGYDGVTVEDICARAEISKKTFFNYFSSKAAAVTGRSDTFPDRECLLEELGAHEGACYLDVLVDVVSADFATSEDAEVNELRRRALRTMPQLFFRGQRDLLAVQRTIAEALRAHLGDRPERRMMPDRPLGHELLVASSAVIAIVRVRSMLHVCDDRGPSSAEARRIVADYLMAGEEGR